MSETYYHAVNSEITANIIGRNDFLTVLEYYS
jgi:hypothetical protein